jgi:hypothetical protein
VLSSLSGLKLVCISVRAARYAERMTVRELLAELQQLPRDAELLAFEPG